MGGIEIVQGLDESNTADLKQIVDIFPAVVKALENAQHKTEISVYELMPCLLVALLDPGKELLFFFFGKDGKFGGIHAAYLNFIYHGSSLLSFELRIFFQYLHWQNFYTVEAE